MRFAILHHTRVPAPHFDLLIETAADTPLLTFRLGCWPLPPHQPAEAIRQPDHRRLYLDYEGPINGNRGHVRRVAAGSCRLRHCRMDRLDLELEAPLTLQLQLRQIEADRWEITAG